MLTSRNRAFAIDNRVARLNYEIHNDDWARDCPEPYLLSKFFRCFAYPIKKCWLVTKRALSYLGRFFRKHICISYHRGHTDGDIESLGTDGGEEAETEGTSLESPIGRAKSEFCRSLQKMFSDASRVEEIMWDIAIWEEGR